MFVSSPCGILEDWQCLVRRNKSVLGQPEQVIIFWVCDSLAVDHHCWACEKAELAQLRGADNSSRIIRHSPKSTKSFSPIRGEMIAAYFVDFSVYKIKSQKCFFELYFYERLWTSVEVRAHHLFWHRAARWRSCDITDGDSDRIWCTCRHPRRSSSHSGSNCSLVSAHQPRRRRQAVDSWLSSVLCCIDLDLPWAMWCWWRWYLGSFSEVCGYQGTPKYRRLAHNRSPHTVWTALSQLSVWTRTHSCQTICGKRLKDPAQFLIGVLRDNWRWLDFTSQNRSSFPGGSE